MEQVTMDDVETNVVRSCWIQIFGEVVSPRFGASGSETVVKIPLFGCIYFSDVFFLFQLASYGGIADPGGAELPQ